MGNIIEFPKQLPLPFDWTDSSYWEARYLASTEKRPTEDAAFKNIYEQSRIVSGEISPRLSKIQKQVYMLELRSFRDCPRWYNEDERHQWISRQTGLFVSDIEDILAAVDIYAFQEELIEEFEARELQALEVAVSKTIFASIVKEVMAEERAA